MSSAVAILLVFVIAMGAMLLACVATAIADRNALIRCRRYLCDANEQLRIRTRQLATTQAERDWFRLQLERSSENTR
jgi:hypothetical protein